MGDELECAITVEGTSEQAEKIAELLSYNWPGCDQLFYTVCLGNMDEKKP